jgi:hypothetical protein
VIMVIVVIMLMAALGIGAWLLFAPPKQSGK